MTAKEYVLSIYPEARFVRGYAQQCAISIATVREPHLTLGWIYTDGKDEEPTWEKAKQSIQEMMLEKLSE